MAALKDEVKLFIVQGLACFDSPSVVADAVKAEFGGVSVSRQQVEAYDPTRRAGAKLSPKWRVVFDETRKAFLADTTTIGISHRAVRLRALTRLQAKAEQLGALALSAQLLEQAAKECGDAYTNRVKTEHTGKDGGPIQLSDVERTQRLAALLDRARTRRAGQAVDG